LTPDEAPTNVIARTVLDPATAPAPASEDYPTPAYPAPVPDPLERARVPTRIGPSFDPPPSDRYNPDQDWFGEPRFSTVPPPRSRAIRWLVVLVLLGLLGLVGATVGRKYVAMVTRPAPAPTGSEARVDTLLDEGDKALADGDLDTAKESFDKASALA